VGEETKGASILAATKTRSNNIRTHAMAKRNNTIDKIVYITGRA